MKTINYGIDLGTSNSCVAYAHDGKCEVFPVAGSGSVLLPSAVTLEAGRLLVGPQAYQRAWKSASVALQFKRALGTNQTFVLKGADKAYRPEELSASVLLELKRMASLKGHTIEHAVISTPATFSAQQCKGTNEAARLAGIQRPVLISEPTAASFGYGFTTEKSGTWLVYDMGAGTFDAVVVRSADGKLTSEVPEGENRLGGIDMDRLLWEEIIIPKLAQGLGIAPDHPVFRKCRQEGLYRAEEVKVRLSQVEEATLSTMDFRSGFVVDGGEPEVALSITRAELEAKVEPVVDQSISVCRAVLARCADTCEILLVGGPTVMPIIRSKLSTLGLPVNTSIDPMTAVATGAALYASMQPVPATAKPVLASTSRSQAVDVVLDYEPACEDEEAPVIVRCEDDQAGWIEIETSAGNWTSGRIPALADGHVLHVPLLKRRGNMFTVKAFSSTGSLLVCEPDEFSIFRGLTLDAVPVPESYSIELENPDNESLSVRKVVIERGTPLPARGSIKVKTTVELSRGSPASVRIKIWEGDRKLLRANRLAYSLTLTGELVPRKLPAGAEIDITVYVDSSRLIRAEAYLPLADEIVSIPKRDEKFDVHNPKQLDERRRQLARRIESVEEIAIPEMHASLEVCRNLIFHPSVNSALRAAKSGGTEVGDACARVDEALRSADEELVGIRERQQAKLLPKEWEAESVHTTEVVASALGNERDRGRWEAIKAAGQNAVERRHWNGLREAMDDAVHLRLHVLGRDPEFWHGLADTLPTDSEVYLNPEEAAALLLRRLRLREINELRADVVRLIRLLPSGSAGGEAEAATRVQLIG